MAHVESNWSSVSEDIIDELVSHLRRKGRWSRDARSLRALNRHWCAALNRHVVEVKPYESRRLVAEDIDSLLKFQNLTALETGYFEGTDFPAENMDRCGRLAKVLSQLSSLRYLTARHFVHCSKGSDLRNLKSIKEIDFKTVFDEDLFRNDWNNLAKIREWSIEKLSGQFRLDKVSDFISVMPSLKVLEFVQDGPISIKDMERFVSLSSRLEAVSLSLDDCQFVTQLTAMDNLDHLSIEDVVQSFEPFVGIRTTSLAFQNDGGALDTAAFQNTISRLKQLRMNYFGDHCPHLPSNFLQVATNLERLFLKGWTVDMDLIQNLQKLPIKEVSLTFCELDGDTSILRNWTALKELSVFESLTPEDIETLSSLKELKKLEVWLSCDAQSKIFKAIGNLTALESLEVIGTHAAWYSPDDFQAFCNLRQLRSLCIDGAFDNIRQILWDMIKSLDVDELRIHLYASASQTAGLNGFINFVKTMKPYLDFKVTNSEL